MKPCPECGSTEIIADLVVFANQMETLAGGVVACVQLTEPKPEKAPFIWVPKYVTSGFHAAVCGECGYTRFYAAHHANLLQARRQGYVSNT